jgi:hypothetical protein
MKRVLKNDTLWYMPVVVQGFSNPTLILQLAGLHACNNCVKPMAFKCGRCMGVGYCSNKCRRADTSHAQVCATLKDKKLPKLRALFIHTIYALQETEPEHELFTLNNRYYHVVWDKAHPDLWTLHPITQHQYASSVSLTTLKNCYSAQRVFCGTEIGVISMGCTV